MTPTPNPIGELITTLKGDRTYQELSQDCDGRPTRQRLAQIVEEPPTTMPSIEQVQGLSKGLKLKPSVIVETWGLSLGLWEPHDWGSRVPPMLGDWGSLTPSQQASVGHLVTEFSKANRGE